VDNKEMSLSKFHINVIFAVFLMIALGVAAVSAKKFFSSQVKGSHSFSQLPKNHPPIDLSKELVELEKLSAANPQNADYLTQIGNIYYDMSQYGKAVDYYKKSLDIRPQDPNVETDLAACFHYLGQHDKSLEILDKVLSSNPNFAEAMFNKGIVLIRGKDDTKGGIAVWENLLRVHPDYPRKTEIQQSIDQLKSLQNKN
jgi:tetratricopeptide (TPR) repeat protein